MSVKEKNKKSFNFSSLKLDLNLLNSKPTPQTLNNGSKTQRNAPESFGLPEINSKPTFTTTHIYPQSTKHQSNPYNEASKLDLTQLSQRLKDFNLFFSHNFNSLDEKGLGHIDYDSLSKLGYDSRIFGTLSLTERDLSRSIGFGDNDTTLTHRKDSSYRPLGSDRSDSMRTIKLSSKENNLGNEQKKKIPTKPKTNEPYALLSERNSGKQTKRKEHIGRSTSLNTQDQMAVIPETATEKGTSKVSKKLYSNIQKASSAKKPTTQQHNRIKSNGVVDDNIPSPTTINFYKTFSVDKGTMQQDQNNDNLPSPIDKTFKSHNISKQISLSVEEGTNHIKTPSVESIKSPKGSKDASPVADKNMKAESQKSFSRISDEPTQDKNKIDKKHKKNSSAGIRHESEPIIAQHDPVTLKSETNEDENLLYKKSGFSKKENRNTNEIKWKSEGTQGDKSALVTTVKDGPEKRNIIKLSKEKELDVPKSIQQPIVETAVQDKIEEPLDEEQKKLLPKFKFCKKSTLLRARKNSLTKNIEYEDNPANTEEFVRAYDHVIKNVQKNLISQTSGKTIESEAILRQHRNSDTNQINLEDLLKEIDETKIKSTIILEDSKPPSSHKIKQRQGSGIIKTFSFKDQVFTININPPIEEVASQMEDVSDHGGSLQRTDSETPPPTANNNSESPTKRMQYKFDVNRKTLDDMEDLLSEEAKIGSSKVIDNNKRKDENLFIFDEIYDNGLENLATKSNKLRCKSNFFAFVENLITFPVDENKHREYVDLPQSFRDENSLASKTGLKYQYKSQLNKKGFEEFSCDPDFDIEELIQELELENILETNCEGFENDIQKEEEEASKHRLKLTTGEELSIIVDLPNWKHSIREFEKASLVNFFDQEAFIKRLNHYFIIKPERITKNRSHKEELQEKFSYFSFLLGITNSKNWEYLVKLTYKSFKEKLYGNYELRVILGEEKILKRRQKRDISKLVKADSMAIFLKRRKTQSKKDENQSLVLFTEKLKKAEQEAALQSAEYGAIQADKLEKKGSQKKVQLEESGLAERAAKTRPRKYSKTSIQFEHESLEEKGEAGLNPPGNEKKRESIKFATMRMHTMVFDDGVLPQGSENSRSSSLKTEDNDKLCLPKKSDTLQKLGTLSPTGEIVKSSTLENRSKFAEERVSKKDTITTHSISPTAANSQGQVNDESLPEAKSNLGSTIQQNPVRGSPFKSELSKSSMTQKELQKVDAKTDSLKSLDVTKKKESSPENRPTNPLSMHRTKSKAIMNQVSYKMDKSGTILRNHMISQSKRVQMNPSELLFDSIYENRVLELQELLHLYPKEWIDIKDREGNSLLMIAVKCGHEKAVSLLLGKKVDINSQNDYGDTALHIALAFNHYNIADELIHNGAKQNIRNLRGKLAWEMTS